VRHGWQVEEYLATDAAALHGHLKAVKVLVQEAGADVKPMDN